MSIPAASFIPRPIEQLVFLGFCSKVVALDRETGELVWKWASPKGQGFVAVLLDGDRLIASAQGYTYCLDPITGQQLWANPLTGLGVGLPCMASVRGTTYPAMFAAAEQTQQEQQAAAAAAAS